MMTDNASTSADDDDQEQVSTLLPVVEFDRQESDELVEHRSRGEAESESDSDSDSESDSASEAEATTAAASESFEARFGRARDHTYLPGTSHPLMSESMLMARKRRRAAAGTNAAGQQQPMNTDEDGLITIPLMLLPGVVLFPGTTVPIRLTQDRWIEYLRPKIQASRQFGLDEEIIIGVMAPPSTTSNSRRRNSSFDNADNRAQRSTRQRVSWMRRAFTEGSRQVNGLHQHLNNLEQVLLMDNDESSHDDEESDNDSEGNNDDDYQEVSRRTTRDPLIGRVGTLVTITHTHETTTTDPLTSNSGSPWHRQSTTDRDPLIVTALGTGRFRVVQSLDDNGGRPQPSYTLYDHAPPSDIRFYRVQRMWDEDLPLPPLGRLYQGNMTTTTTSNTTPSNRHDRIIEHLATVSMIPKFVLQTMWPWKLVGQIRETLDRISSLKGLNHAEQAAAKADEPTLFSFWMASNLPHQQSEKLALLEMDSTWERLKYIQRKLLEYEKEEEEHPTSFVCCKICETKISSPCHLFTVGGAEGTTGAYVNQFGIIHQTITLCSVEERNLIYTGPPETQDSWFPGYSWTITYCRGCRSHLGWMFRSVDPDRHKNRRGNNNNDNNNCSDNSSATNDRPYCFWGFTGASTIIQRRVF